VSEELEEVIDTYRQLVKDWQPDSSIKVLMKLEICEKNIMVLEASVNNTES